MQCGGHCHGWGHCWPFVRAGPAGGPLWEREHVTRDQSANDKAQSDVMGVKKKNGRWRGDREGGQRNDGCLSLYSNSRLIKSSINAFPLNASSRLDSWKYLTITFIAERIYFSLLPKLLWLNACSLNVLVRWWKGRCVCVCGGGLVLTTWKGCLRVKVRIWFRFRLGIPSLGWGAGEWIMSSQR